jgi:ribosomal-protein-alanine N-acetyltransferase
LEIEHACFPHPWSKESFEEILKSDSFGTLATRLKTGELVGYVIFSEVVDELHILNIAVHPMHRRQGIASIMLRYVHDQARQRKRAFAYLEVRESNISAQHLYTKFGYKPLTKRRDYYEDTHEDAILMAAPLTNRKYRP